jgi:hypothetical protein
MKSSWNNHPRGEGAYFENSLFQGSYQSGQFLCFTIELLDTIGNLASALHNDDLFE